MVAAQRHLDRLEPAGAAAVAACVTQAEVSGAIVGVVEVDARTVVHRATASGARVAILPSGQCLLTFFAVRLAVATFAGVSDVIAA
jgi:hypothetical protein